VAPPVFKTGLAANIVAGGFDSLPPPPIFVAISLAFWEECHRVPTAPIKAKSPRPSTCAMLLAVSLAPRVPVEAPMGRSLAERVKHRRKGNV